MIQIGCRKISFVSLAKYFNCSFNKNRQTKNNGCVCVCLLSVIYTIYFLLHLKVCFQKNLLKCVLDFSNMRVEKSNWSRKKTINSSTVWGNLLVTNFLSLITLLVWGHSKEMAAEWRPLSLRRAHSQGHFHKTPFRPRRREHSFKTSSTSNVPDTNCCIYMSRLFVLGCMANNLSKGAVVFTALL